MSDMIYKNHTINLKSQYQLESMKWEPLAMVWWKEDALRVGHPIASGELQDTEAKANALALERAKAWVDAKEQ